MGIILNIELFQKGGLVMAKVERKLSIEKKLEQQEAKRDAEVLSKIAQELPSSSKIKIYKKEDEGKLYITSIPAEDFADTDPHEFIKRKYVKKHGGGDYIVELLDGDGNTVDKKIVSIIDEKEETKEEKDIRHYKIMEEALEMKEEAVEKLKEVEEEKRRAEMTKYEHMIEQMNRQFELIQDMYRSQIDALKEQLAATGDPTQQLLIQSHIDKIEREMERELDRLKMEMKEKEESRVATEKMFDLVNSLLPMILNRDKDIKDPVEELDKTIKLVQNLTGGRKDLIESFLENPEKLKVFQKLIGVDTSDEKKKDFFESLLENPMKADMFKKILGVEEKKDFLTDIMEHPQKFELFKKIIGLDKQEELVNSIKELASQKNETVERKSGFEEIIELASKIEQAKPVLRNMLGVQAQPAKTFVELVSSVLQNAGPYLAQTIQSIMNGMITIEMIKQGKIGQDALAGIAGTNRALPNKSGTVQQEFGNVEEQKPKHQDTQKQQEVKEVDLEKAFEEILLKVSASNANNEGMDVLTFVDKVSDVIVYNVKRRPQLMLAVMKLGGVEGIKDKMNNVIKRVTGIEDDASINELSESIIESVKEKFTGSNRNEPVTQ